MKHKGELLVNLAVIVANVLANAWTTCARVLEHPYVAPHVKQTTSAKHYIGTHLGVETKFETDSDSGAQRDGPRCVLFNMTLQA